MTGWLGIGTLVCSGIAAIASLLAYRLARRQTRDVRWTVEDASTKTTQVLHVVNTGVGRAKHVQISFDPKPLKLTDVPTFDHIDLGAKVKVGWPVVAYDNGRSRQMTITWRTRFGRAKAWSTTV